MKFLPLLMMTLAALLIGCEKHDFKETRELHDKPERVKKESAAKDEHAH
jgi:hypothetical protein